MTESSDNRHHIDGKTNLVGIIGNPVGHSKSPAMHNAAFAALGMNWAYVPLQVDHAHVGDAVKGMRALGLRGANVTVPHKQAVIPFLDALTDAAKAIGAVNTIIVEADGALLGDNTDAAGFAADLVANGIHAAEASVLVLGAGGSARAVVWALAQEGATRVAIANRTLSHAQRLVEELWQFMDPNEVELAALELPGDLDEITRSSSIVVNCTSVGMSPTVDAMPWDPSLPFSSHQIVYDLVYNPPVTALLAKAEKDGAKAIGGIGMLLHQGALAFERWTGVTPPLDVMRAALIP